MITNHYDRYNNIFQIPGRTLFVQLTIRVILNWLVNVGLSRRPALLKTGYHTLYQLKQNDVVQKWRRIKVKEFVHTFK